MEPERQGKTFLTRKVNKKKMRILERYIENPKIDYNYTETSSSYKKSCQEGGANDKNPCETKQFSSLKL